MAYTKISAGAYDAGGSWSSNLVESVDLRTQAQIDAGDPPIMETRYYILISMSVEVKWATGEKEQMRSSVSKRLVGTDGKDYKLQMWDKNQIACAIGQAMIDANEEVKAHYGTGAPTHKTATTTVI